MKQEFNYKKVLPDGSEEDTTLTVETRVGAFSDNPEINNPTGDESAFFYGISIDGIREQLTTFQPGEEGYQPMTEEEATTFLVADINQTLFNYGIYGK